MEAARRSRKWDHKEINFFDDMPVKGMLLDDIKQYTVHSDFFVDPRQLRLHTRANYYGSHPIIKGFAGDLCEVLRKKHIPMYVHTAYRSPALQKQLKQSGNSTLTSGAHQRGAAVDIVHSLYHWRLSEKMWSYIGHIGQEIIKQRGYPIRWGGNFKSLYDPAHWELIAWRELPIINPPGDVLETHTPYSLRQNFGRVTKL